MAKTFETFYDFISRRAVCLLCCDRIKVTVHLIEKVFVYFGVFMFISAVFAPPTQFLYPVGLLDDNQTYLLEFS